MDCITQTSVTSGFWSGLANGDHLESNQSTGDLKKKKRSNNYSCGFLLVPYHSSVITIPMAEGGGYPSTPQLYHFL